MSRPIVAQISASALHHNVGVVRARAPGCRIMAVVKADAYGHGAALCAPVLGEAGVDAFAVASLEEAQQLRALGLERPIVLLEGPFAAEEVDLALALQLILVVHDWRQLQWLEARAGAAAALFFLKVDSGMHRLGFDPSALTEIYARLRAFPAWRVLGLMSHLARPDTPADPYNQRQINAFAAAVEGADDRLEGQHSLVNSAAILALPEPHYTWVRPGLMLYGLSPFSGRDGADLGLQAVLSWRSKLIAIHDFTGGEWLGYGAAWQAAGPRRVGVVAAGYGDGYPRGAGTGTPVQVAGQPTVTLGRVSMDMLFVDLTDLRADLGDPVVLMGSAGPSVESLAGRLETIPYELSCRIQARVPRERVP
ncbi:alanine racemase [Acidithiobacillus sulfuriphilus]|uniref:Alanine racemase n=2 Tax=Acidithiobacillus sulfuriphilus TaxID=1867749 RepID=A0A3M8R152_9PROT|nr:alanine racemase [Acidithiobacillus sulfuriphilus]RNF62287.1 alanine racemase [Acidithiobacillus sulfuriphilus]